MLAYVRYYSVREHGHGMLEQLDSSEVNHGFVEVTSVHFLHDCVTGGRLSTSMHPAAATLPLLQETWIIDRSRFLFGPTAITVKKRIWKIMRIVKMINRVLIGRTGKCTIVK